MSNESLIDGVWGEDVPPTATAALQVHVAKIRQALATPETPAPIVTRAPGYVIEVGIDALDLARFEALAREGRTQLAAAEPEAASKLLRRALECWRGPALVDFTNEPFASAAIARLEEDRISTLTDRFAADLDRGAHAEICGELREITAEHPLRERFWEQLMLASYRCGNQAEALSAFRSARTALLEELGIEPGSALRELERAVLDQSPALERGAASGPLQPPVAPTLIDDSEVGVRAFLETDGQRIVLTSRTTIGRHPDNTVVIDDARVSREHALIRAGEEGFELRDLDSTNGTSVNGTRVSRTVLRDDDVILIGASRFTFSLDDS